MSILKKKDNEEEAYFNFINSLKSEVTKKEYDREIRLFIKYCNVTKLSDLLSIQEPQKQIINYLMSLKQRGLSYNSISLALYAIYHFYEMNDIALNKKKINMFKGEFKRKVSDRAYTHDEIKKILDISDLRMKSIVLLMASSGLRVGAIPILKLRHLEKIDNLYKITVYEGTNDQYYSFCTQECTYFIDQYLEYRTQNGEKLHKDSYLIRDQFDITDLEQVRNKSKGITLSTIKGMIHRTLIKAGIRTVDHTKHIRKEVAECHGFRKHFTTQMIKSKVTFENRLMLEGHSLGITDHYARLDVQDNYSEYQKAIDNLTIDPANRLQRKIKILEVEKSRVDKLEEKIRRIEKMYRND
jgi:site-specific recombinase XerC